MKSILTLIMTLTGFATTSLASATLRIPVQFEGTHSSIPAREINEKLKALGTPLVPEFIEISRLKALERMAWRGHCYTDHGLRHG